MGATVTGAQESRRENGLTVPCKYKLKGTRKISSQAEYVIKYIFS